MQYTLLLLEVRKLARRTERYIIRVTYDSQNKIENTKREKRKIAIYRQIMRKFWTPTGIRTLETSQAH